MSTGKAIEPKYSLDRPKDESAFATASQIFEAIDSLRPYELGLCDGVERSVSCLRFSAEAQEIFDQWYRAFEIDLQTVSRSDAVESHYAKYSSTLVALSLVFELLDWAKETLTVTFGPDDGPPKFGVNGPRTVSAKSLNQAISWVEYLKLHADVIYRDAQDQPASVASLLLAKIKDGSLPDNESVRNVYRKKWAGLTCKDTVMSGLELLEDHSYIKLDYGSRKITGRPPAPKILINPAVKSEAATL